jgi:predicted anti-sigma-YlaC factor YlaD
MKTKFQAGLFFILILFLGSCSINKLVMNKVSDALSGTGAGTVFTGDSDPKLVGDALPFAIKMYEALLDQNPGHHNLTVTTGSLFIMYANAFVQGPAEMLDPIDYYKEQYEALGRAKKLYLRGVDYLNSALDKKFPGFTAATIDEGTLAPLLNKCKKEDVPLLYWAVAGGLSAYSLDVFDFELGSRIPEWGAMIARAYELDPDFNNGAIDDFYILYYGSLPETLGGDKEKAEIHFKRALEKTKGLAAGPYVSYASSICVPDQDFSAFQENLKKALEINPDEDPSSRLLNILSQTKAKYMLENANLFFSSLPDSDEEDW